MARSLEVDQNGLLTFTEECFDVDGDTIFLNHVKLKKKGGAPVADETPSWMNHNATTQTDPDGTTRMFVTVRLNPVALEETSYLFEFSAEDNQSAPQIHTVLLNVGLLAKQLIGTPYKNGADTINILKYEDSSLTDQSINWGGSELLYEWPSVHWPAQYCYFFGRDTGNIWRRPLDGSARELVVDSPELGSGGNHWPILSPTHVYWFAGNLNEVRRCELDGSNVETVCSGFSAGFDIWVDWINEVVYSNTGNGGQIYRAPFGGSQTLFYDKPNNDYCYYCVVDPYNGILFSVGRYDDDQGVVMLDLDGNYLRSFFGSAADHSTALATHDIIGIDPKTRKWYGQEDDTDRVRRFSYEGANEHNYGDPGYIVNKGYPALFDF